ncbi:MAG: T9SS type A sorting domain-containing protein [Candidatus Delongbacteria bacterium]|jgi:hypothetical protein|nr:T9SS type A sorting domain-containing protein [Candidatus Delongbacteria bacterium]
MFKRNLAVILTVFITSLFSAEKYAVLITGDYEAKSLYTREAEDSQNSGFLQDSWNDTYLQWELLVDKKGYDPDNIFVLYRLGEDYWHELEEEGLDYWERLTPQHIVGEEFPEYQITNFPATRESLSEVSRILRDDKKINEDDFLYVWTFGHGGSTDYVTTSYLCMLKETYWTDPITGEIISDWESDNVYDYEFDDFFVDLPANKKVYSMAQCYTGGFKDNLIDDQSGAKVFFDCAADIRHVSKIADNYAHGVVDGSLNIEREYISDKRYIHSEFNFHKYSSMAGENPQFQEYYHLDYENNSGETIPAVYFNEADGIGYDPTFGYDDGIITIEEARRWNIAQNTLIDAGNDSEWLEKPDYSDTENIGYHTSLEYPTLLFNECDDPNSYLFADEDGLSGIIGIVQGLVIQPKNELKLNNSHTTLFDGRGISVTMPSSKLSITNSLFEGKGFDKSLVKGDVTDYKAPNSITLRESSLEIANSTLKSFGMPRTVSSIIATFGDVNIEDVYISLSSSTLNLNQGIFNINSGTDLLLQNSYIEGYESERMLFNSEGYISLNNSNITNVSLNTNNNCLTLFLGISEIRNTAISINGESLLEMEENSLVTVIEGSSIQIIDLSTLKLKIGSELVIKAGCILNLQSGSELIIEEGANLVLEAGAKVIVDGDVKITGDFTLPSLTQLELMENSSLTINDGHTMYLDEKAKINGLEGSSLIVGQYSSLESTITPDYGDITIDNYIVMTGNNWKGIICEPNSSIILNRTKISGAEYAVSGSPDGLVTYEIGSSCIIEQCEITNCENGINLVNCNNYSIVSNTLTGTEIGTGISLAVSNGDLRSNIIENYDIGVRFTSSAPTITENVIRNNKRFGIFVFGHNAFPQLILDTKNSSVNNSIINNGTISNYTSPFPFPDAQIGIMPYGNIYLDEGMNNIYSGQQGLLPDIPCISVAPYTLDPPMFLDPSALNIQARKNYWGAATVVDGFFNLGWDEYKLYYDPWATEPFVDELGEQPTYSSNGAPSKESILLSSAIFLEGKGNYTASIKKYEKLIDKYEDSPEYYVALARLPYVYFEADISTDPLLMTYDEGLTSDNTTHKKFFKEMKIATHIKGKNYPTAKLLAEEMKEEALTDEEVILAEIDIAICDMMMDVSSKRGESTEDYGSKLNDLLSKSYGSGEGDKTEIVESQLPSEFTLYQNYPNPFNPTTEISYALSQDANVSIKVYSSNGSVVADLVNASQSVGNHSVTFDASKLSNGIFYYSLVANGRVVSTKKMLLLK